MADTIDNNGLRSTYVDIYDYVRVFAILCIVVCHSMYLKAATVFGGVDYTLPVDLSPVYDGFIITFYSHIKRRLYDFILQLFFALSGAVLALRPIPSMDKLLYSKAKRLLLPYYGIGLLYMLPVKFLAGFYNKKSLLEAVRIFWIGGESAHLWFLPALFCCFIVFAIIKKALDRAKIVGLAPLFLITVVISYGFAKIKVPSLLEVLSFDRAMYYLVWFTIGYCFEKVREYRASTGTPPIRQRTLVIAIVALGLLGQADRKWGLYNSAVKAVSGAAFIVCLSVLVSRICKVKGFKLPRWLVSDVFLVYLYHDPLNYLILKLAFMTNILTSGLGVYVYILCRTVGVVLVSLVIGSVVNRVKPFIMTIITGCNASLMNKG